MAKIRLDTLLHRRGLFASRARAAASVMAGEVRLGNDGARAAKPGQLVAEDVALAVDERPRFVSRGGIKLANALTATGVDASGRRCLDVGASTGGFTDCLLQRGAEHVVTLDVAYGELDWGLRTDDRVTVIERTNARSVRADDLPYAPDIIVVDVSFISLTLVLAPVAATLRPGGATPIVALVKPQFEVGRGGTDRGVVRDPAAHRAVLERVVAAAQEIGLGTRDVIASPILGPEGNREFLVHLQRGPGCAEIGDRIGEVTAG